MRIFNYQTIFRAASALLFIVLVATTARAVVLFKDEGTYIGAAAYIDCVGSAFECTRDAAIVTISGSFGSGIGAVSFDTIKYGGAVVIEGTNVIDFSSTYFVDDEDPADEWNLAIKDIYVFNTGDTMTGTLVFSGVADDIQTSAGEDFTIDPGDDVVIDSSAQVGVGTASIGASVLLQLESSNMALLVTRVSDPSTDIVTPVNGMVAYDSTDNQLQAYVDGAWVVLQDGSISDLYVDEVGDTMTGTLNFSAVAIDITSDVGEDITLDTGAGGTVAVSDEEFIVGGAGTDLDASAVAEFSSDVKAILLTRVSDVETDIVTPVNGMVAYDSGENLLKGYINGVWTDLGQSTGGGGDITDVFSCASGDANACTIENNEYLRRDIGGENVASSQTVDVYNDSGATIYACAAVYYSGFDVGTNLPEISVADSDGSGTFPAAGLVTADIANGSSGQIVVSGNLLNVDTDTAGSWSAGDDLYLNTNGASANSDCGQTLTTTSPLSSGTQKIGEVLFNDATAGRIMVSGADRVGDGSGLPGGTNTQVQYNDGGVFGGADGMSWLDGTRTLSINQTVVVSGSLQIPTGSAPTTDTAGEIAFDDNAWAASRGAIQAYDGTANTNVVATLASDTPTNGQVPKWNTGGTVTWENDSGGGSGVGNDLNGIDFLVLTNNGTLDSERAFTPGTLVEATDGGAGSTYTLTLTGTFTGGKWCRLTDDGLAFNCAEDEPAGGSGEWTRTTTGQDRLYPTTAPTVDWVVVGASADPASTDPDWTDTKLFVEGTMGATGGLRLGDSNPGVGDDQDIAMWGQVDNLIVNAGVSTAGVGTSKMCFNATTGSNSTCLSEEVGGPDSSDEVVMPNVSGTMAIYTGDTTVNPCSGEADGTLLNDSTSNEICICIGGNAKQLSASTTNCF